MLKYESIRELTDAAEARGIPISRLVLEDQAAAMELPEEELLARMETDFRVMKQSAADGGREDQRSTSGLTGGEGFQMDRYARETEGGLSGPFLSRAMARALAVAGCNASMGRIVAAPTAGSCGILPGCLVSMTEDRGVPEKDAVMAMFTAGAFGMVIASRASIAGAQGGCQAECGSAAAMAAAALTELGGGTPSQCADACAMAIVSQMGLVCDPVAGLVEVPCVKRNAAGAMNALGAAEMALAGIRSRIPADEVIDAMRAVGALMSPLLRETGEGGVAASPTAVRFRNDFFGK